MSNKTLPWSYSSLSAYETCPRRFKLTRITKEVREPQSEAMTHGNEVHKALENHITGAAMLPHKYKQYQPIVDKLRGVSGNKLVEFKFALTPSFKPTTFFAKDAWFRGVIDFGLITPTQATVLDWKTGKPKDDRDQLKLFAVAAFAQHPYVTKVKTGYVWLAHNKIDSETYQKEDVAEIWQEFLPRVQRMTNAADSDNFPPKPSGLCGKWCPVRHAQCEFSGRP